MDVATTLCSPRAVSCTQRTYCMYLLTPLRFYYSEPASSFTPRLDQESSGPLAVIIIPCLLALSTVLVVALIFYSLHKNKKRVQSTKTHSTNGINYNNSLSSVSESNARC